MMEQLRNLIRHGKHAMSTSSSANETRNVSAPPPSKETSSVVTKSTKNSTSEIPDKFTTKDVEAIVAAEKAQKAKLPIYPGLENYILVEKMGDGAFSNVYKAYDKKIQQYVALKIVRKFELNHSQRSNVLKEVQIMRGLNHKSIVALLDFKESKDYYYLILELCSGGELFHQIVKMTYFSEPLARHIIIQVAEGIRYLHESKGVVHRDIKPENLLFEPIPIIPTKDPKPQTLDEDKEDEGEFIPGVGGGGIGQVKIADFGLSKIVWDQQTMTPCGTVGYTAPEIVKDERYSKSVDMWALGCVLYTLLCGFPPFYDESIQLLTEKVARGNYTFLSPWWDEISDSVKDLIRHLLDVNPEKRYTIDEFLAHPWIQEAKNDAKDAGKSEPQIGIQTLSSVDNTPIKNAEETNISRNGPRSKIDLTVTPLDTPRRNRAIMSPDISQLKEVFDVSYAVHRMEEEGARRRNLGIQGGGNRMILRQLNDVEEEDELFSPNLSDSNSAPRKVGFDLSLDKATLLGRRAPRKNVSSRVSFPPMSPMKVD